jgi:hypothetical protein
VGQWVPAGASEARAGGLSGAAKAKEVEGPEGLRDFEVVDDFGAS